MNPAAKLLRWYDRHGRRLPWRLTRNPYRILVSEVMLQQTQVDRVIGFYKQWLKAFPNWATLARASNGDVLRAWAGLGYNRRALMLRDAARHVVKNGVPKTEADWRAVKGIGSYTTKAIMAFAFRARTMPIDTNIRRVGGRLWLGKPFAQAKDDVRIERAGLKWISGTQRAHDISQALFDLAAAHCTKVPDCASCPMKVACPTAAKFLQNRARPPKRVTPILNERVQSGKRFPDRIYRGRIVARLRDVNSATSTQLGRTVDPTYCAKDRAWLEAMLERLEHDGMIRRIDKRFALAK